jgi:rod shape determining protein RodA
MREKRQNPLLSDRRVDYSVILPVFVLLLIGFVALYVSVGHDYPARLTSTLVQQGIWVVVGGVVAYILMHFNSRLLWLVTPFLYVFGLGLMLLPIFYYSPELTAATGAKNWFVWNGVAYFQPSEFMKIPFILLSAQAVTNFQRKRKKDRGLADDFKIIGMLFVILLPIVVLLKFQNDFGTLLVFMAIVAGMILVSGVSWKLIIPVLAVMIGLGGGFIYLTTQDWGRDFLQKLGIGAYQLKRIDAWLDPFQKTQTSTYQQAQALIAVGLGGLFGNGFNVTSVSVPVRESDMIFTVIADNFGFVGSTFLILLYLFLIFRMIQATRKAKNVFYIYISTGIIMMLLFHVFENIGATIGLLPLTGIPLPFVSQGGSSLVTNMIAIGLVLSMSYNQAPVKRSSISVPNN